MFVTKIEDYEIDGPEREIDRAVKEHQIEIGKGISPGVGFANRRVMSFAMAIVA
jgi:hypothetical protein